MSIYQTSITREQFKRLAAGQFVIGKPSIDIKELETFINGAVYAYDELLKSKAKELTNEQYDRDTKAGYKTLAD